tara:strand:+ start:450 stop:1181 length:732 start_codon:yes stop_codon:yes gene_type:complete
MFKTGENIGSSRVFEGKTCQQGRDYRGNLKVASDNFLTSSREIDVSWLPAAAEKYQISGNINDYIINEIPIVTVGVPNRNLDEFPYEEVTSFNEEIGRMVYQTFIGKPTHIDHDNRDPRKAKGVHFDAQLQKVGNVWKIVVLAGWDKTKDPELARAILNRTRTGFSMGALVGYTQCSYPGCDATSPNGKIACRHQDYGRGKGRVLESHLVYERCYRINYIETSSVADPADHTAHDRWVKPWNT